MSNVKNLTQSFKGIPPERFGKKLGRTVAGLALLGFGLKGGPIMKALIPQHADWIITGSLVLGAVMMSFEFAVAPVQYVIAAAKDIANIVRGKNGNGNGSGPTSG